MDLRSKSRHLQLKRHQQAGREHKVSVEVKIKVKKCWILLSSWVPSPAKKRLPQCVNDMGSQACFTNRGSGETTKWFNVNSPECNSGARCVSPPRTPKGFNSVSIEHKIVFNDDHFCWYWTLFRVLNVCCDRLPGISYPAIHVVPLSGYSVGQDFYHPFSLCSKEQ